MKVINFFCKWLLIFIVGSLIAFGIVRLMSGDPHYFFAQHFKTDAVKNHSYYANAEVDKLIDELGVEKDMSKRDALSKEIQAKIYEDLPILYTVDPHWFVMLSDNIKNYEIWNGDYFVTNPTLTVR